jgi:hypothetical protein
MTQETVAKGGSYDRKNLARMDETRERGQIRAPAEGRDLFRNRGQEDSRIERFNSSVSPLTMKRWSSSRSCGSTLGRRLSALPAKTTNLRTYLRRRERCWQGSTSVHSTSRSRNASTTNNQRSFGRRELHAATGREDRTRRKSWAGSERALLTIEERVRRHG